MWTFKKLEKTLQKLGVQRVFSCPIEAFSMLQHDSAKMLISNSTSVSFHSARLFQLQSCNRMEQNPMMRRKMRWDMHFFSMVSQNPLSFATPLQGHCRHCHWSIMKQLGVAISCQNQSLSDAKKTAGKFPWFFSNHQLGLFQISNG